MPEIRPIGDDLCNVALNDDDDRHAITRHLLGTHAWIEVVPGMRSIAVHFDVAKMTCEQATALIEAQLAEVVGAQSTADAEIEIPVCYGGAGGPDLDAVCEALGLTPDAFIALHTSSSCRVDLMGFTPGFAYVGGLPEALSVPRLTEPRQQVPAGTIGIANRQTGLYALDGPGGWPLIGRTPTVLFDRGAEDPFFLTAGARIRFTAIDEATYQRLRDK